MMIRMPIVLPATATLPNPVRIRTSPSHDAVAMKFWKIPTPDILRIDAITRPSSPKCARRRTIRLSPRVIR